MNILHPRLLANLRCYRLFYVVHSHLEVHPILNRLAASNISIPFVTVQIILSHSQGLVQYWCMGFSPLLGSLSQTQYHERQNKVQEPNSVYSSIPPGRYTVIQRPHTKSITVRLGCIMFSTMRLHLLISYKYFSVY